MSAFPSSLVAKAMRKACAEARNWLGSTAPNPPVGAVALDRNGAIAAAAAHCRAGESHAEAKLIDHCKALGAMDSIETLCVTLEPCNHHGHTPPCVEKIIQSGIKRVAIGTRDPNPYVRGGGAQKLRDAGIEVVENVEQDQCRQLIHAFAYAVTTGKPWVTVKQAFTRNGSMIPPSGQKTFTSQESLTLAHRMRKKAGAIVTGSGTMLADNPLFTVRHTQDFPQAQRALAIMDRRKRVPPAMLENARRNGFDVFICDSLDQAFETLSTRGIQDILVEAGPTLSQAVLKSPHWTMRVDIHQSLQETGPDHVASVLNHNAQLPFAPDGLRWEWFLPS
ncbi:MAG: bifunctional diaminohydroxyphosphoribosylaminopyrimidine deaminase/5-amino-6-(5-phosphoribosylamino)uracil reductase RibD [Bdellovibrionales bacterium]